MTDHDIRILIRGAGELGSATAHHLHSHGFTRILILDRRYPKAVRRLVCFSEAVFDGVPLDESAGGDKEAHIDGLIRQAKQLLGDNRYRFVFELGLNVILDDIRDDLSLFGVEYQEWYSERSLVESGAVNKAIDAIYELAIPVESYKDVKHYRRRKRWLA